MTTSEANPCVACGKLTTDRYFGNASSAHPQVGSRRPPRPVALCRTCRPNPHAPKAVTGVERADDDAREENSSQPV